MLVDRQTDTPIAILRSLTGGRVKLAVHDADIDIREDFRGDVGVSGESAMILARKSASWNASLTSIS